MGSPWKHTWSRVTVLGVAALAVVTAVVVCSTRDSERPKVDRAQPRKACAGLLPTAHLASLLPDDSVMRRKQYGTLLEPGHESRALIDCRLDWSGEGEKGDVGVHVRVEPWGPDDELPPGGDVFPFPYRLPHGFRGAVVIRDMYGDVVNAEALLHVACPIAARPRRRFPRAAGADGRRRVSPGSRCG